MREFENTEEYMAKANGVSVEDYRRLTSPDPQELIDWIVGGVGYPYEVIISDPPFPKAFRRALAEAWYERDGAGSEGETLDMYLESVADEAGWHIHAGLDACYGTPAVVRR